MTESEMQAEIERLRKLVRSAYTEGWLSDGGRFSSKYMEEEWRASKSFREVERPEDPLMSPLSEVPEAARLKVGQPSSSELMWVIAHARERFASAGLSLSIPRSTKPGGAWDPKREHWVTWKDRNGQEHELRGTIAELGEALRPFPDGLDPFGAKRT